jgi:putative phosphoribosyl transferase
MPSAATPRETATSVRISAGEVMLEGELRVPAGARGLVLFAHGSGSGRRSPRNQFVASALEAVGLGTLLFDLLTEAEGEVDERTGHLRFDIDLLANRLAHAARWADDARSTRGLRIGFFGASTGGGAALVAAAVLADRVGAVVSRGGRPDLAGDALPEVTAPTLLIVGGRDGPVIALNEEAYDRLRCERRLAIVPGATHLFEEPGALEEVARLAGEWFLRHLDSRVERPVPGGDLHGRSR